MEVSSLDHQLSHVQSTPPGVAHFPEDRCAVYEAMFLEHLDFIDKTICYIARRHAMRPWDVDDFGGWVKLRLIADDYVILRKYQGNSRLTTYLTTVLHNLFRDFRIQRWGKWRPSAAAKRMGEIGVQLESLLYRDGFEFREATEILRNRFQVTLADHELEEIAGRLRPRPKRRFESDAALKLVATRERGDHGIEEVMRAECMARTEAALREVLADLESESRLILRMRFADGLTITAIASALHIPAHRLYPRMRSLLTRVQIHLEELGVSCDEVLETLDWPGCDFSALLTSTEEPRHACA